MKETMKIAVGGVYADYRVIGGQIEVLRVYRDGRDFTDPSIFNTAKSVIRGVKAGWMKIGKG